MQATTSPQGWRKKGNEYVCIFDDLYSYINGLITALWKAEFWTLFPKQESLPTN